MSWERITLDLAIAVSFLHPKPCTAPNQWFHQPNNLGGFLPIFTCNFTSDGFIAEGYSGSPLEKFPPSLQNWLSYLNCSIFKDNFLFQGWFSVSQETFAGRIWTATIKSAVLGFAACLYGWKGCKVWGWGEYSPVSKLGQGSSLSMFMVPLGGRGWAASCGSPRQVPPELRWQTLLKWQCEHPSVMTYKYYTCSHDTEIILQLWSVPVLHN